MKPEQAFRLLIKPHLPGKHWRIENAAGVGMPDIYGVCRANRPGEEEHGIHYWLELKVSDNFGWAEVDKLVTPIQRKWHWDTAQADQRVFVLIRCGEWLELLKCTGKDLYELVWKNQKTNTWDWDALGYALLFK